MHSKYLTHSAQLVQINMVLIPLNKIFIFLELLSIVGVNLLHLVFYIL